MAIFSGPSTNFKNSDNAVKLALLKDAADALIAALDESEATGTWTDEGWSIPTATSDRIDARKEFLRTTMEEIR